MSDPKSKNKAQKPNKRLRVGLMVMYFGLGINLFGFASVGDLFESYLKRVSDVKDSSSLLLSHGGFLDRIDSHLPAFTTVAGILFLSL